MTDCEYDADQQSEDYSEYEKFLNALEKWIHNTFDDLRFVMSADDLFNMSTFVNYFEDDILEMVRQEIGKYKD